MRDGILEAQVEWPREVLKLLRDRAKAGLMKPVDEAESPLWFGAQRIAHAFPVGGPKPAFLLLIVRAGHVFSGGNAEAGQERIRLHQLAD